MVFTIPYISLPGCIGGERKDPEILTMFQIGGCNNLPDEIATLQIRNS